MTRRAAHAPFLPPPLSLRRRRQTLTITAPSSRPRTASFALQYLYPRWIAAGVLALLYVLRVFVFNHGWYIVSYALGLYVLHLFMGFLSPPDGEDGPMLPSQKGDEFRPFVRKVPELKFWTGVTRSLLLSHLAVSTDATDVPVFWPILLCYFLILFFESFRRQITHMWKYKYLPFTQGTKKVYSGKTELANAPNANKEKAKVNQS